MSAKEAETDLILYKLLKGYIAAKAGSAEEYAFMKLIADRYEDFGMMDHAIFFRSPCGSAEEIQAAAKIFKEGQTLMELLPLREDQLGQLPEQQLLEIGNYPRTEKEQP